MGKLSIVTLKLFNFSPLYHLILLIWLAISFCRLHSEELVQKYLPKPILWHHYREMLEGLQIPHTQIMSDFFSAVCACSLC